MQIPAYRYFLAVADTGSVRQAAEQAHISPSAISRQIRFLEHTFKVILFERRVNGMFLTEEGRIIAGYLRENVRTMELAQAQLDELRNLVRGRVSFCAIEGVFMSWLLPAIGTFQQQHPMITFDGSVASSEHVLEAVRSDQVDFGVALGLEEPDASIEIRHCFQTRYLVVFAPGHKLASQTNARLADIVQYPLALLNDRFQTRQWFNKAVARQHLENTVAIQLDHIEMLKRIIQGGQYVSILPDYAVTAEAAEGQLAARSIHEADHAFTRTFLCVRKGRILPRSVQAFLAQLTLDAPD